MAKSVFDHKGNEFASLIDMLEAYQVSYEEYVDGHCLGSV